MNNYRYLILDTLNISYRIFNAIPLEQRVLCRVSNKIIYKKFVKDFLDTLEYWKSRYLVEDSEIYLLFDNPTSRDDLKKLFQPLPPTASRKEKFPEYKANRKAASKEFYNSVEFLRWYFTLGESSIKTCRINHIEADDIVKPLIQKLRKKSQDKILLITNDSDWLRFIDDSICYLPEFYEEPLTPEDFMRKKGYYPTENKIVLDKILNGDTGDNIPSAFPDLSKEDKEYLLENFESIQDIYSSLDSFERGDLKKVLRNSERKALTTFQMVALIPVKEEHLNATLVSGRNSKGYKEAIDKSLGLYECEDKPSFQFSFLSHPRVDPKE
jgi:5'-3' exonuclease